MKKIFLNKIVYANLIFALTTIFLFDRCHSGNENSATRNEDKSDSSVTESSVDYNKLLSEVVDELNKQCPRTLDSETQWDNTSFTPSSYVFQYNYTLVNKKKAEVDTMVLINYISPILLNNAKSNPDMKTFLASKVKLVYNYKDKNGEYVFKVVITPEQYTN